MGLRCYANIAGSAGNVTPTTTTTPKPPPLQHPTKNHFNVETALTFFFQVLVAPLRLLLRHKHNNKSSQ